jgi:hypothetical protein
MDARRAGWRGQLTDLIVVIDAFRGGYVLFSLCISGLLICLWKSGARPGPCFFARPILRPAVVPRLLTQIPTFNIGWSIAIDFIKLVKKTRHDRESRSPTRPASTGASAPLISRSAPPSLRSCAAAALVTHSSEPRLVAGIWPEERLHLRSCAPSGIRKRRYPP